VVDQRIGDPPRRFTSSLRVNSVGLAECSRAAAFRGLVSCRHGLDSIEVVSTDHDATKRLLLAACSGEATLFTRSDEVEAAWRIVDPLIDHWEHTAPSHSRIMPREAGVLPIAG